METAILVIGWIGLAGAVAATLVILLQVGLLLQVLSQILQLAEMIREASRGLALNMEASSRLGGLEEPGSHLYAAILGLARAAGSIEQRLERALPGSRGG